MKSQSQRTAWNRSASWTGQLGRAERTREPQSLATVCFGRTIEAYRLTTASNGTTTASNGTTTDPNGTKTGPQPTQTGPQPDHIQLRQTGKNKAICRGKLRRL